MDFPEHRRDYPSEWAALTWVAGKVGRTTGALRRWCGKEASRRAEPAAQAADDWKRPKLPEQEIKELRRAKQILRKAHSLRG